ncbi:MAG: hypothetical protein WC586_01205 [Methanoregula sp.]
MDTPEGPDQKPAVVAVFLFLLEVLFIINIYLSVFRMTGRKYSFLYPVDNHDLFRSYTRKNRRLFPGASVVSRQNRVLIVTLTGFSRVVPAAG